VLYSFNQHILDTLSSRASNKVTPDMSPD